MRTLNKNRPFGTICGNFDDIPGAKYTQDGAYFDPHGNCLSLDGKTKYDPAKDKGNKSTGNDLEQKQAKLDELAAEVAGYEQEVTRLTNELEQAKGGDINKPGYTEKVSDLQQQLTSMQGKLTRANRAGAVLEEEINKMLAAKKK